MRDGVTPPRHAHESDERHACPARRRRRISLRRHRRRPVGKRGGRHRRGRDHDHRAAGASSFRGNSQGRRHPVRVRRHLPRPRCR
ncbi:MAG: hypothetical protein F4X85_13040 [Acidimicrobiaceae bacterium]|nr:hypothetical protein [Acidimicrobiaceae bacterium]